MPLTLWRGEQLLGELHLRASSSAARIEGVLLPRPGAPPPASVQQLRIPLPGIDAVHQTPWEADVVAERGQRPRGAGAEPRGPVALRAVPPGAPLGVPTAEQFALRADDGQPLPLTHLLVLEHHPLPSNPDPELATFPPGAVANGRVWLVWATPEHQALSKRDDG